jgi:REP element-mobilizing transposase RayT
MNAGRRSLPHETPLWVDTSQAVFFITCCAKDRSARPFSCSSTAKGLLDSVAHRVGKGEWWAHAATIMPDHVHLILSFSQEAVIEKSVKNWKHWTSHEFGFLWQRDFFEHRLRSDESFEQKRDYVLQNPVRAGLVKDWREWPFTFVAV